MRGKGSPVGTSGDIGRGLVPVGLQEGKVKLWVILSRCLVPRVSPRKGVAQCLVTGTRWSLMSQGEGGGSWSWCGV